MLSVFALRRMSAALLVVGLLVLAGCSDEDKPTNERNAAAGTPSTSYTEKITDNKFSITSMTVPADQQVTVTVENDGAAIHNWHMLDVKGVQGEEITAPLLTTGKSDAVTFTIATPGTYHFHCDTHPQEMQGTLTVT
jgi:plastocyanin